MPEPIVSCDNSTINHLCQLSLQALHLNQLHCICCCAILLTCYLPSSAKPASSHPTVYKHIYSCCVWSSRPPTKLQHLHEEASSIELQQVLYDGPCHILMEHQQHQSCDEPKKAGSTTLCQVLGPEHTYAQPTQIKMAGCRYMYTALKCAMGDVIGFGPCQSGCEMSGS